MSHAHWKRSFSGTLRALAAGTTLAIQRHCRTAIAASAIVVLPGCASDPPPPPPPEPAATEAPPPGPTQTTPPATEPELPQPAPRPFVGNRPAPTEGEEPTGPRRVVVGAARTFPPEVMERVRLDDMVDIELVRSGGHARGLVKGLKPTEITVAMEGTQIITRLGPAEVRDVRVIFREQERIEAVGLDDPRDAAEGWTDRFADRAALDGSPPDLWSARFRDNIPLTVTRPFTLGAWAFAGRKAGTPNFTPSATRVALRENDQLKLVATSQGLESRPGGVDRPTGELLVYLVRRGAAVDLVVSSDALQPSNLDATAVARWAKDEPVTLGAYRPGESRRWVRITRVSSTVARSWAGSLEKTPERAAMRQWRATRHAELGSSEERVKKLYASLGLKADADLEQPLVFELRIPTTTGGLRLLPFRKELGLD